MTYHILQKISDDFYISVDNVRKPIATYDEAIEKTKALKVLDDEDNTTYIITQKVGNE
jgi:hypothetical protein